MDGVRVERTLAWMLVFVMPIVLLESGMLWIRRASAMGDVKGTYPRSDIWSKLGRVNLLVALVGSAIGVVTLLLVIAVGIMALFSLLISNPVSVSPSFLGGAGVGVAYVVLRIPLGLIWRVMGGKVGRLARKGQARYALVKGGLEIDLGAPKPGGRPAKFCIDFDELDEVRRFSYLEAKAFMEDTVGPNVKLAARQTRDLYRYYRDEIPRPTVYTLTGTNSVGTNVLLRGPELFYLLSFDADDVSDLLHAFEQHKAAGTAS
jgi:hypothetical protein